jgi:hypothetical protein
LSRLLTGHCYDCSLTFVSNCDDSAGPTTRVQTTLAES